MSLGSATSRQSAYTGNGSTATYAYGFKIFDEDDLLVTIQTTASGVLTPLTITTHYTVTGVGETSGGNVVLVNGAFDWIDGSGYLDTGYKLHIRRKPSLVQNTDIRNQGDFYPEAHENQFDKLVMIDQSQQDELDRSVKLPESITSSTFDPTLPVDIATASSAIVTNASGNGLAVGPTTSEISNAQTYATAASASATAAAASETNAEDWATKTDGIVDATDYSSKAYAIGGTGVTDTSGKGAAKEWAIETASTVDGTDYSAKEYAIGTQIRGASGGGSAKDWATYTSGTADDTEYSAKYYAQQASASATSAAISASSAQWNDVSYKVYSDSPISVVDGDAGTFFYVDCTSGNVVINLPSIAALSLSTSWSIGIKKTDASANTITINVNGSDEIDGASSYSITSQNEGVILIPDTDATPDEWATIAFGIDTGVPSLTSVTKSSTDTLSANDDLILCDSSGGAFTLTLPAAASNSGKVYYFKKTTDDVAAVTIDGNGSETIDGSTTTTINTYFEMLTIASDGTNWSILNRTSPSIPTSFTPTYSNITVGNGTNVGTWWRDGKFMCGFSKLTLGTTSSVTGSVAVTIPESQTYDTNYVPTGTNYPEHARATYLDNGTAIYVGFAQASGTTIFCQAYTTSGAYLSLATVNATVPMTWTTSDVLTTYFKIPISGWKG